jgi:hypothetical protein
VAGYYSGSADTPGAFIRTEGGSFLTLVDDDPSYGNLKRSHNHFGMTAGSATRTVF